MLGELIQDIEQCGAFEEGEIAGAEVVKHGTERLRAHGSAVIQTPRTVEVKYWRGADQHGHAN
jgi:hypothetical protein